MDNAVGGQMERPLGAWLGIRAGKLGCLVSRKAKSLLLLEKGQGLHLTEEWINGDVTNSEDKKQQIKVYIHRDS